MNFYYWNFKSFSVILAESLAGDYESGYIILLFE